MAYDNRYKRNSQPENKNAYSQRLSFLKGADWDAFWALLLIVLLGAYLRFYFDFWPSISNGYPGLSGGSDADFYFNVMYYALNTGHQLLYYPMLDYPLGSYNPFLPFYVWSNVLLAYPISFIFHLPLTTSIYSGRLSAGVVAFVSMSAFAGVISIVVVYFLGKELFSRETGIVAAALMAFMPSILSESTVGFGVHDPFIMMMTAIVFFFLFRSLNTISGNRWVDRWNRKGSFMPDLPSIRSGVRNYLDTNRRSLLYAAMAGVFLGTVANAWEGYTYIIVIISLFYLIQSFLYKIKNRDTMALTFIYTVSVVITLVFSYPVYAGSHAIYPWYYVSVLFFVLTIPIGLVYTFTRDVPWLTVLTGLVIAALAVVGGLEIGDRRYIHTIMGRFLNAQSYFIKSPVYTTIAEALAPPFSLLVLSLGGVIFFIAFAELAYMFYRAPKKGFSNSQLLLVIWSIIAIFMAVSTVRFVLDATTLFVLLGGEGIVALINWTNFGEVRKGLQTYGSSWSGIRKSVKLKHVIVTLFVAFVIVLPLVWTGIDAATPTTMKQQMNSQVYNILPSFLRPPGYSNNGSSIYYFGGFGYSLSTLGNYFPDAWEWLAQRNVNITPLSARPAYLSWWDYGSAAVTKAQVPTVADDFQQGYHVAAAFLFSQNQTQAIALLAARVLFGSYVHSGNTLPANVSGLLASYGINVSYVENVMAHPGAYTQLVLSNPQIYGPFASNVASRNVMWAVLMVVLSKVGLNNIVNLYQSLSRLTHYFIGYFSVDTRLFPFSATDTGVFYAPAFLGGRPMVGPGVYNIPSNYYTITATTSDGLTYPVQSVPAGSTVVSYSINYQPLFYNMTLYRFFMGYSGYAITGQNITGLPGLSGQFLTDPQLQGYQPLPGWMESHFEMVYRTAYYNPWPLKYVAAHPNAWRAIDYSTALSLLKKDPNNQNYTVDLSPQSDFENGIVIMEYYPGAFVNGTVVNAMGAPVAGVRVTLLDQWGIPHDVAYTNSKGTYSLIAPQGKDTVVYSTGPLSSPSDNITQVGNVLTEKTVNVSYSQAMRYPTLNYTTGLPAYNIELGVLRLANTSVSGQVFFDEGNNTTYTPGITPPVTDVNVTFTNQTSGLSYTVPVSDGAYSISAILPGTYAVYVQRGSTAVEVQNSLQIPYNTSVPQNLGIEPAFINGTVITSGGRSLSGVTVEVKSLQGNFSGGNITSGTGSFSLQNLFPGNYSLYVSGDGYTSQRYVTSAVPVNQSRSAVATTIYAFPSGRVSGYVYNGMKYAAYAHLYFYNQLQSSPVEVVANAHGYFSAELGEGNYTIYSLYYSGGTPEVIMSPLNVDGNRQLNLFYSPGYTVSGVLLNPLLNRASSTIYIEKGAGVLQFSSNSSGIFSFILPDGTYSIWVSGSSGAYLGSFTVNGAPLQMRIEELTGTYFTGTVYSLTDGVSADIAGATISFSYQGMPFDYSTNIYGNYSFSLPSDASVNATISAYGMLGRTFVFNTSASLLHDIMLYPESVHLEGLTTVNLPTGSYLVFTSTNGTNSTAPVSNNEFNLNLAPGKYSVTVGGYNNSTVQYIVRPSSMQVPFTTNLTLTISINEKYRFTIDFNYPAGSSVNNSTPLTRVDIFSPELTSPLALDSVQSGQSMYLYPGDYTIYAYAANVAGVFSYLARTVVMGPEHYDLQMEGEYNLSGQLLFNGTPLSSSATVLITDVQNGATVQAALENNASFEVSLPPSTYRISAVYNSTAYLSGHVAYVTYYGSSTVRLNSPSYVTLNVSMRLDNSTVSGMVRWFYGQPAPSTIRFIAQNNSAMEVNVTTASNGTFSVSLMPGTYTVETYSISRTASNITNITVVAGEQFELYPVLHFAYRVNGSVYAQSVGPVDARINFTGNNMSFTIESEGGNYSVLLPSGRYSINVTYLQNLSGTQYTYTYSTTVEVIGPMLLPLYLTLLPTYSVKMQLLSSSTSQPLGSNGFVTVSIRVTNTGDVPNVFYMTVLTNDWYASFDPTYVALGVGANASAIVNATLSSSAPAGGFDKVIIDAYSPYIASANSTLSVIVGVPKVYGFSTLFSQYGNEQPGRTESFSIVVNNTGNSVADFTATVSNLNALEQEGWTGGIYTTSLGPFHKETFFGLVEGKNQTLTVSLTANSTRVLNLLPVSITIHEDGTNNTYTLVVPLQLPNPGISLSGVTVSGQNATIAHQTIIGARRAVIIFILAAFIVADVYLAKKKRLIR